MASSSGYMYRRPPSSDPQQQQPPTLAAGVRGHGGSITMERSEDEKLKFPDRINLDRKGLHAIPILEAEPGLRLLSLQHNFIKRVEHLDCTFRLVFLDLYHNRIEAISNLEPLVNIRVLMLGKNRIRRIEGLGKCGRLSVLDLHGNRITQITGLDHLSELKVLNIAGNLIRKISNLGGLTSLEELNIRRNRIRSTQGLEVVPTLEKLYMSNNEIGGIGSLQKLEALVKLHTVQMEGNPVWSSSEYAYHLVSSLPELKILDQQELSSEVRANAAKWKEQQTEAVSTSAAATPARKQLLKKMEERNVSISNAKCRWNFLKKQTWSKHVTVDCGNNDGSEEQASEELDADTESTAESTAMATLSPSYSSPQLSGAAAVKQRLSLSRQASRNNLLLNKVASSGSKSSPGSPTTKATPTTFPPIAPIKNEQLKRKFPGLGRRRFALPHQKFVNLQSGDGQIHNFENVQSPVISSTVSKHNFLQADKKIGFFNTPTSASASNADRGSGSGNISANATNAEEGQSTSDEFSGAGLLSDSSSADSSSSDAEDVELRPRIRKQLHLPSSARNKNVSASLSDLERLRRNASTPSKMLTGSPGHKANVVSSATSAASSNVNVMADGGRTSEQGRDFLIELDGDLLSVYGLQSLKFLDRPWNRHRATKATTVQFNFVAFDDLVQYLPKFRQTFPNVENFEFLETDIHSLGQLNALALVQGITSLFIGDDGNPIYHKNWRGYAIYRLEHWGLRYVNNSEINDEEIVEANRAYGGLGELAIMVLPQSHIAAIIRKFDLGGSVKGGALEESVNSTVDLIAAIRDQTVKEVIAKEALQYKPRPPETAEAEIAKEVKTVENLLEVGHAAFHKLGRLEEEWATILPILVKRIVTQYSDIRQYKKESLYKLERMEFNSKL